MDLRTTRRGFLTTTLAAGASAAAALSCSPSPGSPGAAASGEKGPASGPVPDFELDEISLVELADGLEKGRFTSRSVTELYLQRIEAVDKDGPDRPGLRAVIEVNPEALDVAEKLDEERRERGPRSRLHGIPVLLKDNIATRDRMNTTAGSLALEGSTPPRDSFVAEKLRAAGAVLLAKTNLSEWANIRSSHSSSGWSARGGQCRNPYALDRNPCGSSSGSGAGASANLGAVAIGTETDGSIVCPSNANGLVGLKPTVGLVSRAGIVPISHSQDTAGPMTRTVRDAAALLSALIGVDPRDPATSASEGHSQADYTRFLDRDGLRGRRLGVAREYFGFHPGVDRVMEDAMSEMKKLGAELIDPVELTPSAELSESEMNVLLYELKADLNLYLADLGEGTKVKTLKDLIAFNEENREREMPYFGQELFLSAEEKGPLTDKGYLDSLEKNRRLSRDLGIDAAVAKHRLDAILAPTGGPAWTTDLVNGDHFSGGSSTLAAVAGYPNITVPAGAIHGLPIGISFFGPAWSEPTLITLAYAFEQATRFRKKPELRGTI
jgi:amidase